ncbi:MAG: hypothetical protein HQL79_09930 [Magnetococcales bacterium]|nr:hypothetical protein [Magnetococcales bacterium]
MIRPIPFIVPCATGVALLTGIFCFQVTCAAPLDEFLSVQQETRPFHGEVEAGWDGMNKNLDAFGVRKDPGSSGTTIGDYSGYHLRGGMAWAERIWTDITFNDHTVKTPYDNANNKAYQAAVQVKVLENNDKIPAIALRMSGWGNGSGQIVKGSPTAIFGTGITTESMTLQDPKDRQIQGDIIASWALSKTTSVSLFGGMGTSKVTVGDMYVTIGGCNYKLTRGLQPDEVNGGMDSTINGQAVNAGDPNCGVSSFILPMSSYSLPELPEGMYISYSAKYYQFGGMVQWQDDTWRLRLGYRLQKWDRGELDNSIASLQPVDKTVYDTNQHITGEVGYKLHPNVAAFVRAQYMTNQFLGDVPYSYNLFSSHKFSQPYGFMTFGIAAGF